MSINQVQYFFQNDGFSKLDVTRINRMYECSPLITGSGGSEPPKETICEDTVSLFSCAYWKSLDYCITRPGYMLERCCATCADVTTALMTTTTNHPDCVDKSTICSLYATLGECENLDFALENCCETCRVGYLITGN